jgi:hypothetical protein
MSTLWLVLVTSCLLFLKDVNATVFNETVDPGSSPYRFVTLPAGTDQIYGELAITGGDYDTYLYILDRPATVTFEAKAYQSSLDIGMVLLQAETLKEIQNDDNNDGNCTVFSPLGPLDSCITITLPAGAYLIVLLGVDDSVGSYVVDISVPTGVPPSFPPTAKPTPAVVKPTIQPAPTPSRLPTPPPTTNPAFTVLPTPLQHVFNETVDPGNDPNQAVILPAGIDQIYGSLAISGGDYDTYLYVLDRTTTVTIEAKAYQSSIDMIILLLNAETRGDIDSDDNNEKNCTVISPLGPRDSCLTVSLPPGGYLIIVTGADDETGSYVIDISVPTAGLPPNVVPPTDPPVLNIPFSPQPTPGPPLTSKPSIPIPLTPKPSIALKSTPKPLMAKTAKSLSKNSAAKKLPPFTLLH